MRFYRSQAIVMYLHQLPGNRKNVPELLGDPIALIRDVRTLVERHRHDSRDSAITGVPVLQCIFFLFNFAIAIHILTFI